jgi:hypothetical protein
MSRLESHQLPTASRTHMKPNSVIHLKASVWLFAGFLPVAAAERPAEPMSVWFTAPARSYHESCPLENGRLGAMNPGGMDTCQTELKSPRFGPAAPTTRTARMPINAVTLPNLDCGCQLPLWDSQPAAIPSTPAPQSTRNSPLHLIRPPAWQQAARSPSSSTNHDPA